MAIKIIDEPDIELTRVQHDQLHAEWERVMGMHAFPQSFESWVRQRLAKGDNLRGRIKGIHNG